MSTTTGIRHLPDVLLADGHFMPRVGFDFFSAAQSSIPIRSTQMVDVTLLAAASSISEKVSVHHAFVVDTLFCIVRGEALKALQHAKIASRLCKHRVDLFLLQPSAALSIERQWSIVTRLKTQGWVGSIGLADATKQHLTELYRAGRRPSVFYAALPPKPTAPEEAAIEDLVRACEERDVVFMSMLRPDESAGINVKSRIDAAVRVAHDALRRGHAHILSHHLGDVRHVPFAPLLLNWTASWQRSGIFGRPLQDDWSYHVRMLRKIGEKYRMQHCPIVRVTAEEDDPVLSGSTRAGGPFLSELRVAPRLELPAAGMSSAGYIDEHRWPRKIPSTDCARPSTVGATRSTWAEWAACVTAGSFHQVSPERFEATYMEHIGELRAQIAALADEWSRSSRSLPRNEGTEKVMRFFAWPSTQAGADQGLRSAASLERRIHRLVAEHLQPWLEHNVYLNEKVTLKQFSVSRNVPLPNETVRMRGNTWHWDTLPNGLIKVLLYLTDVDESRGCMVVMRHNVTQVTFKMAGTKVWGKLASPASIPKEWLLELMERGFRPTCADGVSGTAVVFDTNIVHRASRPASGQIRDSINFEFILEKVASARQQRLARQMKRLAKPSGDMLVAGLVKEENQLRGLTAAGAASLAALVIPVKSSSKALPAVGYGTANRKTAKGSRLVASLLDLFALGGRHIDTAVMYQNHADIRTAIERSHLPRSEFWITSKVNTNRELQRLGGYVRTSTEAYNSVVASSTELGGTIDLMLIHTPAAAADERVEVWRGLIRAQQMGHVRVLGVSNFDAKQIEELRAATGVLPAVNSFEYNPWVPTSSHELLQWCLARGIAVVAYNSLGGKKNRGRGAVVSKLARRLQVSNAQVLLRWALQRGARVIPGATSREHIAQNMNLSCFSLSAADMQELERSKRPSQAATYNPPG